MRRKTSSSGTLYSIIIISTVFLLAVILTNKDRISEGFFGGSDDKPIRFEYYYMESCKHCVVFNKSGVWDKLNKAGATISYIPQGLLYYRRHKENFNKY